MARFRFFGMDLFDATVHVLVTLGAAYVVSSISGGVVGDTLVTAVFASSLVLLAWRRRRALDSRGELEGSARVEELEYRLGELEAQQQRILELEERVDFAERLLARNAEAREERP